VVARDSTVLAVKKRRPKYDECIRYALLHGESDIDRVVLGSTKDKYGVVRKYAPDVICLGYDQERFVEGLCAVFSGEIVRLCAFHPEVYKSSKIKKEANTVFRAKSALRGFLMKKRKYITLEQRKKSSENIVSAILSLPEVRSANTLLLYRPMESEVDIRSLFALLIRAGKKVLVPLPEKKGKPYCSLVNLNTKYVKCSLGYFVPVKVSPYVGKIDVCIAPCVGFDAQGNRLGRGGGWYDRFFAKNKCTVPIGVAFSEQEVVCLPVEKHDKKMAIFCTPEKIAHTKKV
jgi:5-formyltetrahydrofolate cyclo-ligase